MALGVTMVEPQVVQKFVQDTTERDDLVDAYERRITAMKKQLDDIAHKQVNERRTMEAQIARLLEKQRELTERQGKLGSVIERAANEVPSLSVPKPKARPGENERAGLDMMSTGTIRIEPKPKLTREALSAFMPLEDRRIPTPHEVFQRLDRSLASLDQSQRKSVSTLATETSNQAEFIMSELAELGIGPKASAGGPFVALNQPFEQSIDALDDALDKLEAAKEAAIRSPIGHPAEGQEITSRFGPRRDPFNKRRAMHNGIDFRADHGHPVRATAAGKIVRAGPNGGYGRFIEIEHENGVTTRYAHLQDIEVEKGQLVALGDRIGTVGSTGRSTGPHLHYEVRKDGDAVDPYIFITTGQVVKKYL